MHSYSCSGTSLPRPSTRARFLSPSLSLSLSLSLSVCVCMQICSPPWKTNLEWDSSPLCLTVRHSARTSCSDIVHTDGKLVHPVLAQRIIIRGPFLGCVDKLEYEMKVGPSFRTVSVTEQGITVRSDGQCRQTKRKISR